MSPTENDLLTLRTLIAAIREHYDAHAADDPDALDDLLEDAGNLLERMSEDVIGREEPTDHPPFSTSGDEIPF